VNTLALASAAVADFENAAKWQCEYLEFPDLSPEDIVGAKRRLAEYQAHLRGETNGN
jgi:hypothetical protein